MRSRLTAALQWIEKVCEAFGGIALASVVALTVTDVVGRYFFNAPLGGATELTEFGIALVVFAALPAVSWNREHVAVDLLDRYVPAAVHRWRSLAVDLLFALCLIVLGNRLWELGLRAGRREEVSEFLLIPLVWIFTYIAVMCAVTALGLIIHAVLQACDSSSSATSSSSAI